MIANDALGSFKAMQRDCIIHSFFMNTLRLSKTLNTCLYFVVTGSDCQRNTAIYHLLIKLTKC